MNDYRKKIEEIKQELDQLSQKKLEILKTQQQKSVLHRGIQQPDLEIESINGQIGDLERQEEIRIKIPQAAASNPPAVLEKNWSKSALYSHTLGSWNFK